MESIVLLVSCGRRKSNVACEAQDMYNSYRFQRLKTIANTIGLRWYIISAKHGILSPNEIIEPYDLCLTSCTDEYKQDWAKQALNKLFVFNKDTQFVVIADAHYSQRIVPPLISRGYRVSAPFIDKDENVLSNYVQKGVNIDDAIELYNCIYNLADSTGGIRVFSECTGKMYWPKRGVYFFVDFNERSLISNGKPRIVRVGTHAVSIGSKTTLWHRLKTHKGTNEGGGNHRGSIFRLHVGNALIEKEGLVCSTWGKGQNASKDIREKEAFVEHLVSEYIGRLGVIVLDVDDLPAATSVRAFIEKNSISLLSSMNASFNFPSLDWLGNHSPRKEIIDSALWNINYINSDYDRKYLKELYHYADITKNNYKAR